MSRSRKKIPIRGITSATTEKDEKQAANRKLRREVRQRLAEGADATELPELREVSNVWSMSKDGKIPFDPEREPSSLRK